MSLSHHKDGRIAGDLGELGGFRHFVSAEAGGDGLERDTRFRAAG